MSGCTFPHSARCVRVDTRQHWEPHPSADRRIGFKGPAQPGEQARTSHAALARSLPMYPAAATPTLRSPLVATETDDGCTTTGQAPFVTDTRAQKPVTFLVDATDGRGVHANRISHTLDRHTRECGWTLAHSRPDHCTGRPPPLTTHPHQLDRALPKPTSHNSRRNTTPRSGTATPLQRPRSRGEPRSHRFGSGP